MWYGGNFYLNNEQMKVNAWYIWDYLRPLGWTVNAVAGMLGNMQTESTINPAIWESLNAGQLNRGFGLVQWTPATKYFSWCDEYNFVYGDMDSNIMRILYEVTENIQWGNDSKGNPPPYNFDGFTKSTDSPYNLGILFLRHYERPAEYDQPIRGTQANYWYEVLTGEEPPDPPDPPVKNKKLPLWMYIRRF